MYVETLHQPKTSDKGPSGAKPSRAEPNKSVQSRPDTLLEPSCKSSATKIEKSLIPA